MFKKCIVLFTVVLLVLFIVGCEDAPGNETQDVLEMEKVEPNVTFSDDEITKTEVGSFFDRFNQKLDDTIGSCENYMELESQEITYEEAMDFDKTLCGDRNRIEESFNLRNLVALTADEILNYAFFQNETINSSTELEVLSSKALIEFGDDALRFISYNQDDSKFNQFTFAIVDGELYVEYYSYNGRMRSHSDTGNETPFYQYHVFYENNYQIFDKLYVETGREHLSMNLETSDFYYYNKRINYSMTDLYYGNDAVTNRIHYTDSEEETIVVSSQIYDEDVFSMDYSIDVESNESIGGNLAFSAFELPGWDNLKIDENGYHMYDGDSLVYPDHMIKYSQQEIFHYYFPPIVLQDYDLDSDSLMVGESSVDLSTLKDNIDNLSNNYLEILDEYDISLDLLPLEDYIDDFGYIDDIAEDYLNE